MYFSWQTVGMAEQYACMMFTLTEYFMKCSFLVMNYVQSHVPHSNAQFKLQRVVFTIFCMPKWIKLLQCDCQIKNLC